MSGSISHIERLEYDRLVRLDRLRAESDRRIAAYNALDENRAAVQSRLEALVCEAAGWSKIESEFQAVISLAAAGNIVDVAALDAKIAAWKAAQTPPAETEAVQTPPAETEVKQ